MNGRDDEKPFDIESIEVRYAFETESPTSSPTLPPSKSPTKSPILSVNTQMSSTQSTTGDEDSADGRAYDANTTMEIRKHQSDVDDAMVTHNVWMYMVVIFVLSG